jgi:hypothetical protein
VEQEGIVCSGCNTLNEPGWSFCQQCGSRLSQPKPAPPPQPPAAPVIPADLRTVPEQHAVIDPMMQGLKTNPDPQPAEHPVDKVVASPPEPVLKTVADAPAPVKRKVVPAHPLPAAPPAGDLDDSLRTVFADPPIQPKPTAPTPPPVQPKPTAPAPSIPKPSIPPPPSVPAASIPEPTTTHGKAMSGALCNQCGQSNTVGSAFCASCGSPMTFGKTMVISSQPGAPPPKGSLHLVMEGGQPGEVYDLGEDTVIGRNNGEITFPHDGFMSGRHARIERRGSSFILTDEGSRNGSFIKIKGEVELKPGDMILVGKQLFRFEV